MLVSETQPSSSLIWNPSRHSNMPLLLQTQTYSLSNQKQMLTQKTAWFTLIILYFSYISIIKCDLFVSTIFLRFFLRMLIGVYKCSCVVMCSSSHFCLFSLLFNNLLVWFFFAIIHSHSKFFPV